MKVPRPITNNIVMKFLRLPITALLAASTLFAFAPASLARTDRNTNDRNTNEIVRRIYKLSEDGDARDIREFLGDEIVRVLGQDLNSSNGRSLAKRIISILKKNKSKLAKGVTNQDLDRALKRVEKKVVREADKKKGNVTPPESSTQNI
jgi:hypothetical protein